MHNYRELKIWQRSMDLVVDVYKNSKCFPKEETYGLTLQMRKAVISIPSNIAEGAGRNTDPQFQYFLEIAMASTNELQTQLELARRLKYLEDAIALCPIDEAVQIYKMTLVLYYTLDAEPSVEVSQKGNKPGSLGSPKGDQSSNISNCLST